MYPRNEIRFSVFPVGLFCVQGFVFFSCLIFTFNTVFLNVQVYLNEMYIYEKTFITHIIIKKMNCLYFSDTDFWCNSSFAAHSVICTAISDCAAIRDYFLNNN